MPGLYKALLKELDVLAKEVGVTLDETNLKDKFRELIPLNVYREPVE